MKIKYITLAVAIVAIAKTSYAQYSQDAIRFSGFQTGSTSRIKAVGNAGTAIGGDLSSISGNPAGVGFFTRSEFSVTPEFNNANVKATYLGQNNSANSASGNLNNASVVFFNRINKMPGTDKTQGLLSLNFGVGYARTNDFYQKTYYAGTNKNSSIADYYAGLANQDVRGNFGDPSSGNFDYLEGWAYQHYLINKDANNNYAASTDLGGDQMSSTIRSGGQSEINLALGANYSNKLYFGLSLGITDLRYNYTSYFTENNTEYVNYNQEFTSIYGLDQATKGSGVNGKFGVIYKPVEAVRLGATFTTPTWITIDDNTAESLNTQYSGNGGTHNNDASYGVTYTLRTPAKVAGGLSIFIKQFGFITGDIEYVDYTTTHITSNDYDPTNDNTDIKQFYKSAVNYHAGAEARLTPNFFLRGGYGIQGNPMKQYGSDIKTASGGLGFRFGSYYVDATYTHVTGSNTVFPYTVENGISPSANLNRSVDNVYLTFGLRF